MLRPYSTTSFYLDNELVDTEMILWNIRQPNGATVHKRIQAVTKLRAVANELANGYSISEDLVNDNLVRKWIREAR